MRVAMLGSGILGKGLGAAFVSHGHEVMMASRTPRRPDLVDWAAGLGPLASVGEHAQAAELADLVAIGTSWDGTRSALELAGLDRLAGKIVIDAINPLRREGGWPRLVLGHNDSGGEQIQRWLPASYVVKAFSMVSVALMADPTLPGGPPDMFIAGNDAGAKRRVTEIATSFGWPVLDCGDITASRLLEPMTLLHIEYYLKTGIHHHAFRLLRP